MPNSLEMRNLFWFVLIFGLVAVVVRYQTPPPTERIGITWQDWKLRSQQVFVFTGDRTSSQAFFPWNAPSKPPGPGIEELHARLLPEIPLALEEPCQGEKAQQLTLIQGSQSWTVSIGTRPGPAQKRILNIMNAWPMPKS